MPSSTQEIGPVRGRSHYREVHCQVLPHQLPAQVCWEAPGIYVHQERMLSQPVTREDGRDMAGSVLPVGKLDWFSTNSVFTCCIRIQGPPSSALDRPDQDTTQIPERLFCHIHSTAMGCAGLLFLFYSYCVHFRDEIPRSKGTNWPRGSGAALV